MPLRARITNPEIANQRPYATNSPSTAPVPGDEENDVLFGSKYGVRTIELNRPKKLNSLNGSMARKIIPRLQEWQKSDMANVIVIKGAGRAFCAGGDVAALAQGCAEGEEGQQRGRDYFALEYQLDHLIATYTKPYVAFIDGITMGGGVGLSVHAPFRIATERTVFAMPETTIGLFPDVGAGFFLPRMDGALGTYLAMTSERLKGAEVYFAGIATHYIDSTSLPDLEARLAELRFEDYRGIDERLAIINSTIEEFNTGLPHDQEFQLDSDVRRLIDYVFHTDHNLKKMIEELEYTISRENISEHLIEWAQKTLNTIRERSPTSVAVTQKQLRLGRKWSISETFQNEYAIASRFMSHSDFVTGVTAKLIDKVDGRPAWAPNAIADVTDKEIDEFFRRSPDGPLELLNTGYKAQYKEYPYAFGLPREVDVKDVVLNKGLKLKDKLDVVAYFLDIRDHKIGTKEKVEEILERKTEMGSTGLRWVEY